MKLLIAMLATFILACLVIGATILLLDYFTNGN